MTMLPWQVPLTTEAMEIATGSLLWAQIIAEGTYPGVDYDVNVELCLDVLARCEEHGVEVHPNAVVQFVAALVHDQEPDLSVVETVARAADLIVAVGAG